MPEGLVDDVIEVDYFSFYRVGEKTETKDEVISRIDLFADENGNQTFVENKETSVSTSGWYVVIITFKDVVNHNTPNSIRKIIKINVAQG
jgi:hypothetical protein